MNDIRVGDTLRYHDDGEGLQHGEHVEVVRESWPRHVHTRHTWPDGVVTLGRFWLNEWRERCNRPGATHIRTAS